MTGLCCYQIMSNKSWQWYIAGIGSSGVVPSWDNTSARGIHCSHHHHPCTAIIARICNAWVVYWDQKPEKWTGKDMMWLCVLGRPVVDDFGGWRIMESAVIDGMVVIVVFNKASFSSSFFKNWSGCGRRPFVFGKYQHRLRASGDQFSVPSLILEPIGGWSHKKTDGLFTTHTTRAVYQGTKLCR